MVWLISTEDVVKPVIKTSKVSPPELFKYGFSTEDPSTDYIAITSTPQYVDKLPFHPGSFVEDVEDKLKVSGVDRKFLELYEIMAIFDLGSVESNDKQIVKLNNLFSNKTPTYIYHYSKVDVPETVVLPELISNLSKVFASVKENSNVVIQIMETRTGPTAEFLYYLSTLCESLYIYKPSVISDLYDMKYVIMKEIKKGYKLDKAERYIASLGLTIPNRVDDVIQCMNVSLTKKKIDMYDSIKEYLKNQIYDGVLKDRLIDFQNLNAKKWVDTFIDPKKDLLDKLIVSCELKSVYDINY